MPQENNLITTELTNYMSVYKLSHLLNYQKLYFE